MPPILAFAGPGTFGSLPPGGSLPGGGVPPIGIGPFDLAAGIPSFGGPFTSTLGNPLRALNPNIPNVTFPTGQFDPGVTFPRFIVDPEFRPGDLPLAVSALPGVSPSEAAILAELAAAAAFPTTPTGRPSPEAIAEGALTFAPQPPPPDDDDGAILFPFPIPLPGGGGGPGGPGMPEVTLSDLISQGIGAVRDIALGGGQGGSLGGSGFGGVPLVSQFFGLGGNGNGPTAAIPTTCPPARPRMPGALTFANPCSPSNPTVYLNAGSVSSMLSPKVLASQARKLARANRVVPKKTVRRKKGR